MIADAVGVQTSTLYHHFSSKEQILYRIAARATTRFIDTYSHLLDAPGDAPDVLKSLVRVHVVYFYENSLAQQVAARELRELEPAHFEEVRRAQRDYLDRVMRLVERGSRERQLVIANSAIATRAMFDMLNNFNRWFAPRPDLGLSALADLYASMIVDDMLGAVPARSAPKRR
jgi:AcrR family transcriptional regulator